VSEEKILVLVDKAGEKGLALIVEPFELFKVAPCDIRSRFARTQLLRHTGQLLSEPNLCVARVRVLFAGALYRNNATRTAGSIANCFSRMMPKSIQMARHTKGFET
jgi:hypothetical protein